MEAARDVAPATRILPVRLLVWIAIDNLSYSGEGHQRARFLAIGRMESGRVSEQDNEGHAHFLHRKNGEATTRGRDAEGNLQLNESPVPVIEHGTSVAFPGRHVEEGLPGSRLGGAEGGGPEHERCVNTAVRGRGQPVRGSLDV